jgi:hypothetical protein
MAIPGNAKSIMEQDQKGWRDLKCSNKDQIPESISEIDQWIQNIALCISANLKNTDQISRDPFSNQKRISDSFGILAGGQLMNALGDNNDCLIHSFLTCVSPSFRKLEDPIRSRIAGYFRRFILANIPGIDAKVHDRLQSYHFLTGGEIEFLSKTYQIPIINIQDGDHEIDRTMEIFPASEDSFLKSKNDTYTGPFYIIHGDNVHFTPIAYNGVYDMMLNYGEVNAVAATITAEHAEVFMATSEENAKLELVKQDFKDRIQPIMASIKKEIADSNNNNQQKKSIKMSSMLEILTPITDEYIEDIIRQKLIGRELLDKAHVAIRSTLVDELSKNILLNTPNTFSNKMKDLEKFAGQHGLSDDDALSKAIKASLNESSAVTAANMIPSVQSANVILRTMSMKARIGADEETHYNAIVYKSVKNGGKRNTKKASRVKRRNTKKTKRVRN